MHMHIEITGLHRVTNPKPSRTGHMILAWFDATVGPFELRGCAFVRTHKGALVVWPPKLGGREDRQSVRFLENWVPASLLTKVQETYRALGGTDGEIAPPAPPAEDAPEAAEGEEVIGLRRFLAAE